MSSPPPPQIKQDQEDTSVADPSSSYEDCLHLGVTFFKQQMSLCSLWQEDFLMSAILDYMGRLIHGEKSESNEKCQKEKVT